MRSPQCKTCEPVVPSPTNLLEDAQHLFWCSFGGWDPMDWSTNGGGEDTCFAFCYLPLPLPPSRYRDLLWELVRVCYVGETDMACREKRNSSHGMQTGKGAQRNLQCCGESTEITVNGFKNLWAKIGQGHFFPSII